ncbi:MAG: D-alanyl-D-alanine carboxypeptidase family protein [Methylovulum sp.]|nr:D-alanyl-D-alanine carboxypeptidase family protein [Methylovulum sp.]
MTNVKLILLILMPLCLSLASQISYGRHAAILIDADSGKIVHEVDATHAWYPASLTKVMTLYMTFAALDQRQIQLDDSMPVSHHASRQPTSKLGLRAGERLTVQEAILALITRSANDASVVLAEHLGGNEENFAAKMTAKAHILGMYDTHFMNATGLPHQWQVTTPRDLALLAWKIRRDFPHYYPYFAAHSFFFRGQELRGINKFTAGYPGAEGMKTGFTCGSGYNLMSSAQQNGKRLIGVVMGGMTSAERYRLMIDMMNDGFANNFNAYPDKHITTLPSKFAGTAPYQLGCGKGAPVHLTAGKLQHVAAKGKKSTKTSHTYRKTSAATKTASKSKSSKTRYHH